MIISGVSGGFDNPANNPYLIVLTFWIDSFGSTRFENVKTFGPDLYQEIWRIVLEGR